MEEDFNGNVDTQDSLRFSGFDPNLSYQMRVFQHYTSDPFLIAFYDDTNLGLEVPPVLISEEKFHMLLDSVAMIANRLVSLSRYRLLGCFRDRIA